jgi:hypothetical protein
MHLKTENPKVEWWNALIDRHHSPIDGKYLVGCIPTTETEKWSLGGKDERENLNEKYNVLFSSIFPHDFFQSSGDSDSPLRHSSRVKKQSFSNAFFNNRVVAQTFRGQDYQLGQVSSINLY